PPGPGQELHGEPSGCLISLQRRVIRWFDHLWRHFGPSGLQRDGGAGLAAGQAAGGAGHPCRTCDTLKRRGGPADVHCEPGPAAGDVRRLRPRPGHAAGRLLLWRDLRAEPRRMGSRRTASVRSVGYSQLLCLARADLWAVLRTTRRPVCSWKPSRRGGSGAIEQRTTGEVTRSSTDRIQASAVNEPGLWTACGSVQPAEQQVPLPLAGAAYRAKAWSGSLPIDRSSSAGGAARPGGRQPGASAAPAGRRGKVTAAEQRQLRHKSAPGRFQRTDGRPGPPGQRLLVRKLAPLRAVGGGAAAVCLLPNRLASPGELPAQPVAVAGSRSCRQAGSAAQAARLAGQSDGSKQAGLAVLVEGRLQQLACLAGGGSRSPPLSPQVAESLPAARQPVRALP
uniref:Collagen alpha-1(I) chain-like n=1 Tax=Macrostomum lignano TaxID=282301 RepID=A0A1I8FKA8_9PLAT